MLRGELRKAVHEGIIWFEARLLLWLCELLLLEDKSALTRRFSWPHSANRDLAHVSPQVFVCWCKPCLIHVMIHQQKINKQRFFIRIKNYTNIQLLLCFQSVSDLFHNNYNKYVSVCSRLWDKCKLAYFMRSLLGLFYISKSNVFSLYLKCV